MFYIKFLFPLLLLVIIPALALVLVPYFKIEKKYRRTRNRVCAMVLSVITMILAVATLSGMYFEYTVPNDSNEIILLVDVSDSDEVEADTRDEFVQTVLTQGRYEHFKMGIVKFGFDQVYAVPLTDNVASIYEAYLTSPNPDTTATDIASALVYAKSLFSSDEAGKIVLITDGKETDESALSVIRSVVAGGIQVDVAFVTTEYTQDVAQITSVDLPDYHVNPNEECTLTVNINSKESVPASVELYDNDELADTQSVNLNGGEQNISLRHTFTSDKLHNLTFKISVDDVLEDNNTYTAYYYIEVFNKILILERYDESEALKDTLTAEGGFNVDVLNVYDDVENPDVNFPKTVEDLRIYDQVILNNVSNESLPLGLDEMLYTYVNSFGGGLLTVGGEGQGSDPNAYGRTDMSGTVLQQLLPVQAVNYTPPVALMIVIDHSGSMEGYLEDSLEGARSCLNQLSERDYMGLMTLDNAVDLVLPLTPCSQKGKISMAINSISVEAEGGTLFTNALERSGEALRSISNVSKKHIMLVTDGNVSSTDSDYSSISESFHKEDGIEFSVVLVGASVNRTGMQSYMNKVDGTVVSNTGNIIHDMRDTLVQEVIGEVNNEKSFYPVIYNPMSPVVNGIDRQAIEGIGRNCMTVELDGFYGTKIKAAADLILAGDYNVPVYAQWKFGAGSVGSFMCDLSGNWSSGFLSDSNGVTFIVNAVNSLMPVENIRPPEIDVRIKEYNYLNQIGIYTNLKDGEYYKATVKDDEGTTLLNLNAVKNDGDVDKNYYVVNALSAENNFSKATFVLKNNGVYVITVEKYNSDGAVLATAEIYKSFSYSKEYDAFTKVSVEETTQNLQKIAELGGGSLISDIEDPWEIFDDFETVSVRKVDPRIPFMIILIIAFLLVVVVRKFKFKWPHEIIRERKNGGKK